MTATTQPGAFDAGTTTADRPAPRVSVVVATYERPAAVASLLRQLEAQTLPATDYEVVVVDDGSRVPLTESLAGYAPAYGLTVLRQANGGPAAARDAGIRSARGELIVVLDDDMSVGAGFVAAHAAAHGGERPRVVLGRMEASAAPDRGRGFLDRWRMIAFEERAARLRAGNASLHGEDVYTGNVSFPRREYLAVGGFDTALRLSEDIELGLRLERAGAEVVMADAAWSSHEAASESAAAWMRRAIAYGASEARIGKKHPDVPAASPWRHFARVQGALRPFLVAAVVAPWMARGMAWLAVRAALALDRLGTERAALAMTTLSFGLLYMRGVSVESGGGRRALPELRRYLATGGRTR